MKIKNILKKLLLTLFILIVAFVIYSLIPRVSQPTNSFATELNKSDILSKEFQEDLRLFAKDTATKTEVVIALKGNEVIFENGNTKKLINCHSARKSIISLLIGIAKDKGFLELDESLERLAIDESKTPLTAQEKNSNYKRFING